MHSCSCINEHWLVASVSLATIPQEHDCQVSLVTLFSVTTALMRASSPKQMFRQNKNCCHTWLIWVGHLSAVEHCNLLCTMLCAWSTVKNGTSNYCTSKLRDTSSASDICPWAIDLQHRCSLLTTSYLL